MSEIEGNILERFLRLLATFVALLGLVFGAVGRFEEEEPEDADADAAAPAEAEEGVEEPRAAPGPRPMGTFGPRTVNGLYQLPSGDAIVVELIENNGPVAPEDQQGLALTITADGRATYVETPPGGSPALAEPTAEQIVVETDLGAAGLQSLLAELDALGFFALTEAAGSDPAELPVGGPVRILTVTLEDGTWTVADAGLSAADAGRFSEARAAVIDAGRPEASAVPAA
jgi:hypothetical protein